MGHLEISGFEMHRGQFSENGYDKNLRDWFKLIYEVLFGEKDGPRMGFFISFFGVKETIKLLDDKIK